VIDAYDGSSWAARVGQCAHRAIALTLQAGAHPDRLERTQQIIEISRAVLAKSPIPVRTREALANVVSATGIYLHRFALPEPWTFVGSEIVLGDCRIDLAWECDNNVLVDEIKLGIGRPNQAAVADQIRRYQSAATKHWGSAFLGVRLCAIDEPMRSRIYPKNSQRSEQIGGSK